MYHPSGNARGRSGRVGVAVFANGAKDFAILGLVALDALLVQALTAIDKIPRTVTVRRTGEETEPICRHCKASAGKRVRRMRHSFRHPPR